MDQRGRRNQLVIGQIIAFLTFCERLEAGIDQLAGCPAGCGIESMK
ncbi:MAG TPA: hypothetical protein VGG24_12415 [Paraburkholderia sp.]